MSDYISFIRFDVIFAIVVVAILIASAFKNQRKTFRDFLCLVFSVGLVGTPLVFDYRNWTTRSVSFLNAKVFPLFNGLVAEEKSAVFNALLTVLLIYVVIGIVYLIAVGLSALIGGSEKLKYKRYPAYATKHRPVFGIIVGIFQSALIVYCSLVVLTFIGDYSGLDFSKEWLYNFFRSFDPVVNLLKNAINNGLGV